MRVLWIFAHPEARSLNGALRDAGVEALTEAGHEVVHSDLYAMGWDPVVSAADFGNEDGRLHVGEASRQAREDGKLRADIRGEQEKLDAADAVILQYPLWWFGMPAILKGWMDRVLVQGYAYRVRHPETGRTRRYGDGGLAGKRGMVVVTVGAPESALGPRAIDGDMNDVLFPVQHGFFWYTGMRPLDPFVVPGSDRIDQAGFERHAGRLRARMRALPTAEPIAFRHQDGGDYDERFVLRPDVAPGLTGYQAHYAGRGQGGTVAL
ncbi:NAD(P)H-dependent oxidoreductase [Sciscionella sediminilitoris]|uniref:NAD(P)H-dependent oxidoreductase n=1 Tax=Sciscionella sediminilitoris TaxID=1445613 RepID=UPI0004DF397C|nr:NAD(P)H-dependent oxidoreductase [Sciscionella sp. SE31]